MNLSKSWKFINISNINTGGSSSAQHILKSRATGASFGGGSWSGGGGSNANGGVEELNVEIYLNKPVQIGCVQLKLKFNRELSAPYELRLFRPKKSNEFSVMSSSSKPIDLKY